MTAAVGRATGADARLPDASAILPLAARENFSVASLLVGRADAGHLIAIYGFARLVDQLGDEVDGDRLALLDCVRGRPRPRLRRRAGAPAAAAARSRRCASCDLPREPFLRLIEANRRDQRQARTRRSTSSSTTATLSANPVGELVLHVFGAATPERIALSDRVCTGAPARRALAGRRRGLRGAGASTCRPRTCERFGVEPRRPRRGARPAPRCASCSRSRSSARGGCSTRARRSSARCAAARASRSPATSAAGARTLDAIAARRLRRARRPAAGDAARRRARRSLWSASAGGA